MPGVPSFVDRSQNDASDLTVMTDVADGHGGGQFNFLFTLAA